jgi:hypothetical protein
MAIIQLPNHCGDKTVIAALDEQGLLEKPPDKIAIHIPDPLIDDPSAIGFLAAWGLYQRQMRGDQRVEQFPR